MTWRLYIEEFQQFNHRTQERCQQFCDLTPGCTFWTWYKVHCDKWGLNWNYISQVQILKGLPRTMIITVCLFSRLPCMGDEFTKRQVVLSKRNHRSHHLQKHQRCAMLWSLVIWSFRSVMAALPEQGWVLMMLCIGKVSITIWRWRTFHNFLFYASPFRSILSVVGPFLTQFGAKAPCLALLSEIFLWSKWRTFCN